MEKRQINTFIKYMTCNDIQSTYKSKFYFTIGWIHNRFVRPVVSHKIFKTEASCWDSAVLDAAIAEPYLQDMPATAWMDSASETSCCPFTLLETRRVPRCSNPTILRLAESTAPSFFVVARRLITSLSWLPFGLGLEISPIACVA